MNKLCILYAVDEEIEPYDIDNIHIAGIVVRCQGGEELIALINDEQEDHFIKMVSDEGMAPIRVEIPLSLLTGRDNSAII